MKALDLAANYVADEPPLREALRQLLHAARQAIVGAWAVRTMPRGEPGPEALDPRTLADIGIGPGERILLSHGVALDRRRRGLDLNI